MEWERLVAPGTGCDGGREGEGNEKRALETVPKLVTALGNEEENIEDDTADVGIVDETGISIRENLDVDGLKPPNGGLEVADSTLRIAGRIPENVCRISWAAGSDFDCIGVMVS